MSRSVQHFKSRAYLMSRWPSFLIFLSMHCYWRRGDGQFQLRLIKKLSPYPTSFSIKLYTFSKKLHKKSFPENRSRAPRDFPLLYRPQRQIQKLISGGREGALIIFRDRRIAVPRRADRGDWSFWSIWLHEIAFFQDSIWDVENSLTMIVNEK